MNCQTLNNNIRLEEVLASLGHLPVKCNEKEAWFLNPFGLETEASFKIDRHKNVWYLFSEGKGGKTADFIVKYFNCSVSEALSWAEEKNFNFSFQKQNDLSKANINITEVKPLSNYYLKKYLKSRGISSKSYHLLNEVKFTISNRKLYAIGFRNLSGGYELRNSFYKGCTSKDISFIQKSDASISVFEGFIDALSYLEFTTSNAESLLILNSVSMLEKAKTQLQNFSSIKLFLDNDKAGERSKNEILSCFSRAEDCSKLYEGYKDFNDFFIDKQKTF
ncbi:toprim domain-containing protein [Chryseobacterium arthrosphaerae]|uniref:toprim domain-containing protein n=1 Tax=Chryseobacterium arthrosphaerae TaxID=651561 RepID=UPI0023E1F89B|nr:toprim domain-containing protein [Chryseobacterium arthrosphaerae]WES97715.1 toprim domain-containing protein [Chryseobacterium arthrosphaerae]